MSEVILAAMAKPPCLITKGVLRASLAIFAADGQYADGEKSEHTPSKSGDLIFTKAGRRPRIAWDGFHRIDKAGVSSMRSSPEAVEFFDILHTLQAQFGYGQGRSVARAVADVMGTKMIRHRHAGGTRKFVYLSEAVESFLGNFGVFMQSIRLRKHQAETENRTAQSNEWWSTLARRVATLSLVSFLLFFQASTCLRGPLRFLAPVCFRARP